MKQAITESKLQSKTKDANPSPTRYNKKTCNRHAGPLCSLYENAEFAVSYSNSSGSYFISRQHENNHKWVFEQTLLRHLHLYTYQPPSLIVSGPRIYLNRFLLTTDFVSPPAGNAVFAQPQYKVWARKHPGIKGGGQ